MSELAERLRRGEVLVADGAMGTLLLRRGLGPGMCPEWANLHRPEWLEEITSAYVEAGADVVETNTFGASPVKLADHGLEADTEAINIAAVRAARAAAGDAALIAGSIGPSGRILKPYGDTDPTVLLGSFERQAEALGGEGVDLVVVETMTDLREALLALEAVKNVSPGTPVAVTLTFDLTPRGHFTIMGQPLEKVCDELGEAGADLMGSNCGVGIDAMIEVSRAMRGRTDLPLVIQPNAGLPRIEGGEAVYPETPEYFGERVGALLDQGVSVIGGCCGTAPEHIRAIRSAVDARRRGP